MKIVAKEDYDVLMCYGDLIEAFHMGKRVSVTSVTWDALYPIVRKYFQYNGTRTCSFCLSELMSYAWKIKDSYEQENER